MRPAQDCGTGIMKRSLILLSARSLAGCAVSAGGLLEGEVDGTWYSERSPLELEGCMAEAMSGNNNLIPVSDTHWAVTRVTGYGFPNVRWDFIEQADGRTLVELRSSVAVTTGEGDLEGCLGP